MIRRALIAVCFISFLNAIPLEAGPVPPPTTSSEIIQPSSINKNEQLNKTLEELMQQQADNVKQIVAEQNLQLPEFPSNHKKEEELEQTNPKENVESTFSLDELKIKCQHLSKLLNLTSHSFTSASQTKVPTGDSAAQSQIRPVYVQHRNQLTVTPTHKPYKSVNGFYITSKPSILPTLPPNVKFIKLEPVILQKTILNDGRIVYYWHRSLPSSIQYPSPAQNDLTKQTQTPYNTNYNTPSTTTTPSSSGLSISHYFPFYWSSGSNQEAATEKPITTTTTTTVATTKAPAPAPATQKVFERDPGLYYANQLRFVVPVPYEEPENATRQPWAFDQFAYYPPQLQPSTVNVQVPYTPTFQMIKALTIPNKYVNINPDGSYENTNKA